MRPVRRSARRIGAMAAFAAGALAGCAGLPSRREPVSLPPDAPLVVQGSGGEWPAADWWTRYQDSVLDRLIEMALKTSPTLATAHARFDSARQSVRIAGANTGARVDVSADGDRQRLSDNGLFSPRLLGFQWYNQFDLGLQASYTFDWWGKQRDSVESAVDEAQAAQADRAAAALVLASSVADTYFGWQADQSRLALARERERTVEHEATITRARIRAQLDPGDELERAVSALAAARERSALLEGSARLRIVTLAALVGGSATDLPPLTARPLPSVDMRLPDDVKLDLIGRRADVMASRWRVEAAERTRAGARADFFPDISVNALMGLQSLSVGNLLEYGSRVPAVTGAVHLPIFDAGRLKGRYGAAQAAVDSAVASYQDAVVSAAREVASQAATGARLAAQRAQRVIEVDAALRLESSAAARARQGLSDLRPQLTAAEALVAQREALLDLDAETLSADIGLKRALGGGYAR